MKMKYRISRKRIQKAADAARKRVSAYSPWQRAALLVRAKALIREGAASRLILAALLAAFTLATGALLANSHPDAKSNGLGSPRFPDHYAGAGRPTHP